MRASSASGSGGSRRLMSALYLHLRWDVHASLRGQLDSAGNAARSCLDRSDGVRALFLHGADEPADLLGAGEHTIRQLLDLFSDDAKGAGFMGSMGSMMAKGKGAVLGKDPHAPLTMAAKWASLKKKVAKRKVDEKLARGAGDAGPGRPRAWGPERGAPSPPFLACRIAPRGVV